MTDKKSELKILICEDDKDHLTDIKFYLDEFSRTNEIEINTTAVDFTNYHNDLKKDYDLLILDYFDGDNEKGETVLSHNESAKKIKTLIYSAKLESNKISYNNLQSKYKCLIGHEPKLKTGDNLKNFILNFLFNNNLIENNYELFNENDIFIQADIRSIGENYLKEIIYKISKKTGSKVPFVINRMMSGLSGAVILKITNENNYNILKISKETDNLRKEYDNAKSLYRLFPDRHTISINEEEYESNDKNVLGILIKEVNESETLFSFIINSVDRNKINNVLSELLLDDFGLKGHYKKYKNNNSSWVSIFNKIDKYKFSLIDKTYEELKPLIDSHSDFSLSSIKNLVIDHRYSNFDFEKTDTSNEKPLILCHGDFHSKNILIQGTHPIIIYTGGIGYAHWSLDICRLIVNLFITALDNSTKEYYDINLINSNIIIANQIIEDTEIEFDGRNDNAIFTINWLVKNCKNIYEDYYSKYEFQLGLMKEFLQVSYRVGTIPPNKRAIALIAAYNCMIKANESIKT